MHIGIVVGEASGDILGAGLMSSLKQKYPEARFSGLGGPRMLAHGFESLFEMDRLSVMGIWEPLKRLPELLKIRKGLYNWFCEQKLDVVIGIDSPDFNLDLELKLRKANIKTVHYVSPSVWAWRQGRIKKIARAVDLILTLFPFEADFYLKSSVPVQFVGHPLADLIADSPDMLGARTELGLPASGKVVALLPGSRRAEVDYMAPLLLNAAKILENRYGEIQFVVPFSNSKRGEQFKALLGNSNLNLKLVEGRSRRVMEAADAVMLTSGTASLEAMLLKKPMVVAYRTNSFTYALIRPLVKAKYITLPNLLADKMLVDELIQSEATAENIAGSVMKLFENGLRTASMVEQFKTIHLSLKQNASKQAANHIIKLVETDASAG